MYKNLIYITGNDSYGIEQEVKRWIGVFESKYSELNIERIRLENRSNFPIIRDNLTTTGLFADKRLFLFSGGIERKTKGGGLEELLEQIKEDIPEDHFCIFHNLSSKEESLMLWLGKNADIRNINTVWSSETWQKRFPEIPSSNIKKILSIYQVFEEGQEGEKKNPNLGHTIATTLESFSLSGGSYDISEFIHTEGGGKMFDLVDLILTVKVKESILLMKKMTETMNPAEFIPSLIGLLRSHLYIKFLLSRGITSSDIGTIIKVHPFVLKKSISSRISLEKLHRFFTEIVQVNKAYKSGKGLQDVELGRIFGIEIALMGLKK